MIEIKINNRITCLYSDIEIANRICESKLDRYRKVYPIHNPGRPDSYVIVNLYRENGGPVHVFRPYTDGQYLKAMPHRDFCRQRTGAVPLKAEEEVKTVDGPFGRQRITYRHLVTDMAGRKVFDLYDILQGQPAPEEEASCY
ncbi:MAG: hypothetical protein K5770_03995 [Lachnospiraceae bacterium]|nr:hypothetical protein [Lachnospiraceae bacterium]